MIENNQAIVLWKRCLAFIKDNVNTTAFTTWFEPIVPIKYEGKALTIGVPSPFFYEYLEEKYVDLLRTALYKEIGEGTELMYSIVTDNTNHIDIEMKGTERSAALPEAKPVYNGNKAPTLLQAPVVQDLDPHLNPNYNFENFIKGTSNEFSLTVAETVAQNPARTFNPLFLYGPSGVGKTHLINAIGTRIKELYPEKRVLYISAHLFQVQYTDSIRTNHFNDFITFYQQIDVLIIDDIQEFAGVTKTQNTFFHIFNHLHQNGKQLILTSDRAPVMLQGIEDRLLTRFKWGLIAELERPDIDLRKNILRSKIRRDGLNIPDAVIEAARIDGAGEYRILWQVVLPMSIPIIATLALLVSLNYWNDWLNGLYYINTDKLYSIQVLLNKMLMDVQYLLTSAQSGSTLSQQDIQLPATGIKMAVAVMGALPILAIYPFFQKYFVKGIVIGAVKG